MKYIVIELQTAQNGTVSNIVTAKDTLLEAESTYHSILAAAAISNVPVHAAVLIDSTGNPIANRVYIHGEAAE